MVIIIFYCNCSGSSSTFWPHLGLATPSCCCFFNTNIRPILIHCIRSRDSILQIFKQVSSHKKKIKKKKPQKAAGSVRQVSPSPPPPSRLRLTIINS